MPEFRVGQRVHVEYDGVIVEPDGPYTRLVRADDASQLIANIEHMTALAPADWPPVVGDVWERNSDGTRFLAGTGRWEAHKVFLASTNGHDGAWASDFNPADLTLILPAESRNEVG